MVRPIKEWPTNDILLAEAKNTAPYLYVNAMESGQQWPAVVVVKSDYNRISLAVANPKRDFEKVAASVVEKYDGDEVLFIMEVQCEFGGANSPGLVLIHGNELETSMWATKIDKKGEKYSTRNWDKGKNGNLLCDLHTVFNKEHRKALCEGFNLKLAKSKFSLWK